jgi:chaperonin GroEL
LLDSGATIARRLIALPEPDANVGAMLARAVIWQTHEAVADGTATAAVIFERAVAAGLRALAAGADPWTLRRQLECVSARIDTELAAMARPVSGKARLTRLAAMLCHDPELAPLIGEILDVVGPDGQVEIHAALGRRCGREYAEGMHWPGGVVSPQFITDQISRRVALTDCGMLISDLDLSDPADITLILDQARAAGMKALVITAQRLSDAAIGALLTDPLPAFAVKLPGAGETARMVAQQDLAVLTGGQIFSRAAGDSARQITPAGFGRARIAWADRDLFGLIGGKGDPRALRRHIAGLRAMLSENRDRDAADRVRERLSKLLGGSATLHIGGATATEIETRKESATRAVTVLRGVLVDGVVPGAGGAYLACGRSLGAMLPAALTDAERLAIQIALAALEAPARAIIANAGHEPAAILARCERAGAGFGYDAATGQVVDLEAAGLYDSAAVARAAVRIALAAAGQALTIDTVVVPRSPATATTPLA